MQKAQSLKSFEVLGWTQVYLTSVIWFIKLMNVYPQLHLIDGIEMLTYQESGVEENAEQSDPKDKDQRVLFGLRIDLILSNMYSRLVRSSPSSFSV